MKTKHAFVVGLSIGLLLAVAPSCSSKPPPVVCSSDNCTGCCDDTGSCANGNSNDACGSNGISCQACSGSQTCVSVADGGMDFQCRLGGGTGGGSGGGSGGGTGTGGGSVGDGGCNASNCTDGCCSAAGCTHYGQQGFSKCGANGATCSGCMVGKTCQLGVCSAPNCDACLDTAGNCRTDKSTLTDNHYCGRDGGVCSVCDTTNGAMCVSGRCVGMSGSCNATNCDGCCAGNTCIGASDGGINDAQCGLGANQCATCTNASCDKDAGVCTGQSGAGGGGGIPGFGDGGVCDSSSCPTGCCDFLQGCVQDGTMGLFPGAVDCKDPMGMPGDACKLCLGAACAGAMICF